MFYEGNLAPGSRLTQAHVDATVLRIIDEGIFRGVELHEYPTTSAERTLADFIARQSLATDNALRFARTVFCARMPVTEDMLVEVMDFLNELNHEYATGEADYEWSGFSDNCVHTLRNALAAASIWTPTSVRVIKLRQIFNLAIPANEFVNLARLGAEGPLEDYGQVYGDSVHRDALIEFDWLPTRHGALVKTLPVHAENDLYDTAFRIFVLQAPFRQGQVRDSVRLLSDERFVEVGANLRHFAQVYAGILENREEEGFGLAGLRGDRYRRVRRRYYAYIEKQQSGGRRAARPAARGLNRLGIETEGGLEPRCVVLQEERRVVHPCHRGDQTQSQPAPRSSPAALQAVETLHDLVTFFGGYAGAGIRDGDIDRIFGSPHLQRYPASFRGVLDGVVEEVGDRLEEQVAIALDGR